MLVHRIGTNKYIRDLSGEGAKRAGGRWNRKGVPVLYTSPNIALCAWEYFVHLSPAINLADNAYSRITISVPDASEQEVRAHNLPDTWPMLSDELYDIADTWIASNNSLCLKVPSAVIAGEFNYIVNPVHPLASKISVVEVVPYNFDERAFGKTLFNPPLPGTQMGTQILK